MARNLNPNWLALLACYRALCESEGVESLTEEELRTLVEQVEHVPDPAEVEVWVQ